MEFIGKYHDVVTLEAVCHSNTKPLPHKQLYYPTTLSDRGSACACRNLCLYLCIPSCNLSEYSLCHTGNRGIEAILGMFHGGTSSLPITSRSPNLSFREFLAKMNSAQQIQRAEHSLSQIEGSTIVASTKKH